MLGKEEQKALGLVKELLSEADISIRDGEKLSAATLKVWAGTFDDVWVWGSIFPCMEVVNLVTPVLAKSLRRFAEEIQSDEGRESRILDTFRVPSTYGTM